MTPNWERIYITNVFMKNIVVDNCVNLFALVIRVRKWHILSRFSWLNFCLTGHSWLRSIEGNLVWGICSLCTTSTSLWLISSESNLPIISLLYITSLKTLKDTILYLTHSIEICHIKQKNLRTKAHSIIRKCNAFCFQNCFLRVILAL